MVEALGRKRGDTTGKLEGLRMRKLKGWRIVELGCLRVDCLHDRAAIVASIGTPQSGAGIEHGAAFRGVIVHILGTREEPRRLLEGAVGGEREPIGLEIVGDRDGGACWR